MSTTTITRSSGINPGLAWAGPLPGGGYDGRTKHLDRAVLRFATWLQARIGGNVQVRFNSHRLSGGAYTTGSRVDGPIPVDRAEIGLSARLDIPQAMWKRPEWEWTDAELEALPLQYHVSVSPQFLRNPSDLGEHKPSDRYGYWTVKTPREAYRLLRRLLHPIIRNNTP
jgi:hypothetical protein